MRPEVAINSNTGTQTTIRAHSSICQGLSTEDNEQRQRQKGPVGTMVDIILHLIFPLPFVFIVIIGLPGTVSWQRRGQQPEIN